MTYDDMNARPRLPLGVRVSFDLGAGLSTCTCCRGCTHCVGKESLDLCALPWVHPLRERGAGSGSGNDGEEDQSRHRHWPRAAVGGSCGGRGRSASSDHVALAAAQQQISLKSITSSTTRKGVSWG